MEIKRIDYIHSIRGMAIFFIVATHCNLFTDSNEFISKVWSEILREWTAVFLLISGFLFQHLLPKYQIKKFFTSKAKNVIIPYIIISIPAIAFYLSGLKKDHNWVDINDLMQHSWFYIISFFYATGSHLGPLWFIPMLILIFISSGMLKYLGEDKARLLYAAVFSFAIVLLTSRPDGDSNPFLAYIHFLPVYILGMFICCYKDLLINKKLLPVYFSIFIILFTIRVFLDINPSITIISKIFLFISLCILFGSVQKKNKLTTALSWLANASFAIYFIHGYFVGLLRMKLNSIKIMGSGLLSEHGILLSIGLSLAITVTITLFIFILKKHKLNTRVLFGS